MVRIKGQDWVKVLNNLFEIGNQIDNYDHNVINLIASDNAVPKSVSDNPIYQGYIIQEGLVGSRPFAGSYLHDLIEEMAANIACDVFEAEHANLQPHSCSQANQAVYHAILAPGDTVLSLDFQAGGHLTHGLRSNFSGRHYNFFHYGVTEAGMIDYHEAKKLTSQIHPKLIICGSSSFPRLFDASLLRGIADDGNAKLMFDLSHEAGLIAGGAIPNIVNIADVVTMSTDKTLRGPFGGIILCKKELANAIDRAVHPGTQSSFPIRKIASTAQSLAMTQLNDFRIYAKNVLENAKVIEHSFHSDFLFTKGTDKHYIVLDVKKAFGITGTIAEKRLEKIGILSNRQSIPSDSSKRMSDASGLRIGSAWATSRGFDFLDFKDISEIIIEVLSGSDEEIENAKIFENVKSLIDKFRPNDVWLKKV